MTVLKLAGKPFGGAAATPMSPKRKTLIFADGPDGVLRTITLDILPGDPNMYSYSLPGSRS